MTESDPQTAIRNGLAALGRRETGEAAQLLRSAIGRVPDGDFPWIALANCELMLERFGAAAGALERILHSAPRDLRALLLSGWAHEKQGNDRAATSFYSAARNQAQAMGGAPADLAALLEHGVRFCAGANKGFEAHLRGALSGALSPTMTEAVELLTGERELYLQQPSVFYYPGLAHRRFFEVEEFPWLEPMLALVPEMQRELAAVMEEGGAGFAPYVQRQANRPAPNNPLLEDEAWTAFYFWQNGAVVEDNARRCPATMEALAMAPMPSSTGRSPNAHWSRLLPGAHIAPHTGMLNTRLICHIPIKTAPGCSLRVGSETRGWEDGVPLIFDDSIEHEARNTGPEERVVLLFEIWRPEIPEEDRDAISRIFEAIGEYGT